MIPTESTCRMRGRTTVFRFQVSGFQVSGSWLDAAGQLDERTRESGLDTEPDGTGVQTPVQTPVQASVQDRQRPDRPGLKRARALLAAGAPVNAQSIIPAGTPIPKEVGVGVYPEIGKTFDPWVKDQGCVLTHYIFTWTFIQHLDFSKIDFMCF